MNILVTGSAGFVGQNLVPFLRKLGHIVTGIDLKKDSLSNQSYQQDILKGIPTFSTQVDLCIHLASLVGGILKNNSNEGQEEFELDLLKEVHHFCKTNHCKRIIYTSSITVFEQTQNYNHGPLLVANQKTPYAKAKKKGENFVQTYFDQFVILRPTNIFGRIQQETENEIFGTSHVIPELLKKIDSSQTVEVFGDGTQVRNFIHTSDICNFFERTLVKPLQGWYNLKSEIQISIKELVQSLMTYRQVTRTLKFQPEFMKYEPLPIPKFDMNEVYKTGWKPLIKSIDEGLSI